MRILMKHWQNLFLGACILLMGRTEAGEPAAGSAAAPPPEKHSFLAPAADFIRDDILQPKQPFELVPGKDPGGWSFSLEPYVWALGLSGNVGVKGFPPSHIGVSSRSVIEALDWGIFLRGEVRKGRWGMLADGYYAALSSSASPENKIYSDVDLGLQQSIISLALAYRIIDDRRGFLDVYAGARYNFLGLQASGSLNGSRIDGIGTNAAETITSQLDARLDSAIEAAVAKASGTAQLAAGDFLSARLPDGDLRRIILKNGDLRQLVRDGVIRHSLTGGDVRGALATYVRAQAAAKVAGAKGIIDPSLTAATAKAKRQLAEAISRRVEEATPTYAAGNKWWFDPIVGLRGQINITRWLFLAAQGDVGGFGAGSQIAWNTQATVGFNFTRNIFAEIGYRYMYVDYANGGFLYNMNSYGLFSGVGVKF